MHIHQTPTTDERSCECGALISEDERDGVCAKCHARYRWQRRSDGRRRHPRRDSAASAPGRPAK